MIDWRGMVWAQFGAAIDMLENAIRACPEEVWAAPGERPAWKERDVVGSWYLAYHALFWLDCYLTDPPQAFVPPAPITLAEWEEGALPERAYTKGELLAYLTACRERCRATIHAMSDEAAQAPCGLDRLPISRGELLLYNLRHVQHHVGQLQLLLRQKTGSAPHWVPRAGH